MEKLLERKEEKDIITYFHKVKPNTTYTLTEAKKKLEYYCAYQERCHKEVEQKLRDMRMIPEAQEIIITHLLQYNYLNESRFAQAFARGKFRTKKWGKKRIISELKFRYISPYNIKLALKEISEEDYNNTFYQLAEKRFLQLKGETNSQKKRKKFSDYLFYRGWESQKVFEAWKDFQS